MIDSGIGANSAVATGLGNSVKLEADNTEYFSRTPSSDGNRQNFTFSTWIKRTELGQNSRLLHVHQDGQNFFTLGFDTSDRLVLYNINSSVDYGGHYSQRFRDTSAWYHIVFRSETTSNANQWRIYVNGVEITAKDTDYGTPPRWYQSNVNRALDHRIGYNTDGSNGSSQYMAETHLVDGTPLLPTSFGEFDEDSGIWKPKAYEGSYSTNGFYLDYTDSSDLGNDANGSNNFTATNIAAADQATDIPINNFAIMNPLNPSGTYTEGATKVTSPTGTYGGDGTWTTSTMPISTGGKWYCEVKLISTSNVYWQIGLCKQALANSWNYTIMYRSDGLVLNPSGSGGNTSGNTTFAANDIMGMAYDSSARTLKFYKNGTLVLTKTAGVLPTTDDYFWGVGAMSSGTFITEWNFGGYTASSISSAKSDDNGYGTFEYAPPTGYYALCTKNLAEYG
jgi:hypothetical protein